MSDTLYLSLWFPNLRFNTLADKLVSALGTFAQHGGEAGVYSATVWPVSWSETACFQQVFGAGQRSAEPLVAVSTALEQLHDDFAYEFQIAWNLWELETPTAESGLEPRWARGPRLVRVIGFGPLFEEGCFEQDGHIRIDFGADTPFLEEDADLDAVGSKHVEENILQLIALAHALEKATGASARLLWSELGENLAERLAARLGKGN